MGTLSYWIDAEPCKMPACNYCGARTLRAHRTFLERLTCRRVYRCTRCSGKLAVHRTLVAFFHSRCVCPSCGSGDLNKLSSPKSPENDSPENESADKLTTNPVRRLLGLMGAPLYHCTVCHFQFHDFRPLLSRPEKVTFAVNFRR
jgi:DNA-directed RNA polymerase subunit RPC12/RpoP